MKKSIKIIKETLHLFALLCVLFLPIPLQLLSTIGWAIRAVVENAYSTSHNLFPVPEAFPELSSDSLLLYWLVLFLMLMALVVTLILSFITSWRKYFESTLTVIRLICAYFVALQLLKYGFAKIFKTQFYLPEPNILFTPFGQLSQDILFWSTIGSSYTYCLFAGLAEIIAGGLILWKKTRTVGLLLGALLFCNVVAINLGFDISVKLFSILLLFLSLLCLSPHFKSLYVFFIVKSRISLVEEKVSFPGMSPIYIHAARILFAGIVFLEALYPFLASNNFNDDKAQRPFLHGAYQVQKIKPEGIPGRPGSLDIKRFFIHRQGYLIFQDQKDQMEDFQLKIDQNKKQFIVIDYSGATTVCSYTYNSSDSTLALSFPDPPGKYVITSKYINWRALPAIQSSFHWTIEAVK